MSWIITPTYDGLVSDADAAAYLAAVQAADGQLLEPATRQAINTFVVGCKTDGIWTAIKASCILAGARTLAGALVPLAGTAPTNNGPFVSGDYNRKTGLVGNAGSKFLSANRAENADPRNSFHLSVFVSTLGTGTYIIGAGLANFSCFSHIANDSGLGTFFARNRETAATTSTIASNGTLGFLGTSRALSSGYTNRGNATDTSVTSTSAAPGATSITVFRDGQLANGVSSRLAFYSIGESLDLALLDARVTTLINAFAAAIP
jgi:hypothetical protein